MKSRASLGPHLNTGDDIALKGGKTPLISGFFSSTGGAGAKESVAGTEQVGEVGVEGGGYH